MLALEHMNWRFQRLSMPWKILIITLALGLCAMLLSTTAFAANLPTFHPEGGGPGAAQATKGFNWFLWWVQLALIGLGILMIVGMVAAIFTDHDKSPVLYLFGLFIAVYAFQKVQDPQAFMTGLSKSFGNG